MRYWNVVHLVNWCPLILPYLDLPPASRILIAENGNHVDVWEDRTLLEM
ncbi:immunity protein Imm33 domain-containing protein [Flavobacterium sp. UBA4197]